MSIVDRSDIGNLYDFVSGYYNTREQSLSWFAGGWADREQWRTVAKAKVFELLGYLPRPAPLDAETLSVTERKGYTQHEVRFNTARNVRVAGTLLIPAQGCKPYPAVVALHDHSGFYYYGREKMLEMESEPEVLTEFKREAYGGRSWASELARRGYVISPWGPIPVLLTDASSSRSRGKTATRPSNSLSILARASLKK